MFKCISLKLNNSPKFFAKDTLAIFIEQTCILHICFVESNILYTGIQRWTKSIKISQRLFVCMSATPYLAPSQYFAQAFAGYSSLIITLQSFFFPPHLYPEKL